MQIKIEKKENKITSLQYLIIYYGTYLGFG